MLETRSLFLTERFTKSDGPRAALSGTVPDAMVAMRGEREGFQVAVHNTSGGALELGGRVAPDSALASLIASGALTFEVLRVGFVNVPAGSTGMGTSAGFYEDPLPPFVNDVANGRLTLPAGEWGGAAIIAKVRTDATPGTYTGSVELFTGTESVDETVQARQAFTIEVRGGDSLMQSGSTTKSFKTVMNVEGEAYWLQHEHMRNGVNRPYFLPADADRMAQVAGLLNFLGTRDVTPLELPFANPSQTGAYTCAYDSPGSVPSTSYLSQLSNRYFAATKDVDPATKAFPARMAPTHSIGCNPDPKSEAGSFDGTLDRLRTPSVKQDDFFNPNGPSFFKAVANAWTANGFFDATTYVKSPFDEPGDATKQQRATMMNEVPKANVALHAAFGAKAKIVLAGWPRDARGLKVCRTFGTGKRCTNISGDSFDNRKLWDGKGTDDVDIWMPAFARLFGRTTPAKVARDYKVNREADYAKRLKGIRAKKPGRETWAYNFFTASKVMPQVTIDAPGTDPRLQYWMLARDGHTGVFISNLMMGWGTTPQTHSGSSLRRKGDPYQQALYFKHPKYGYAAGWGTFIYPGYSPSLGLVGETRRNSTDATPVTSLRMEALRDGTEDGNLIAMYRAKFGDAALQTKMKAIFPGRNVSYPASLGNVVGPYYNNGSDLAQRMETLRRTMIVELTS